MSLCDSRDGAGVVRTPWRAGASAARKIVALALAVPFLLGAATAVAAWDATRMLRAAAAHGQRTEQAAQNLTDLIARAHALDDQERLAAVNDHINRAVAFTDDRAVWGADDYWASPIETLAKGAGDCEDYAIAKYFSLLAAGMPVSSVRLVYVRAMLPAVGGMPARAQPHMVLAYYAAASDDPLILDNLVGDIRRASRRSDLTPVFSFNGEGLWQGAGAQTAGDPMARLSRWRDVVRKARAEGFE